MKNGNVCVYFIYKPNQSPQDTRINRQQNVHSSLLNPFGEPPINSRFWCESSGSVSANEKKRSSMNVNDDHSINGKRFSDLIYRKEDGRSPGTRRSLFGIPYTHKITRYTSGSNGRLKF